MPTNPINPQTLTPQYYHPMLQESIQHFLTQTQAEILDYTHFNLMFSRLIQTMSSPPIEIIWFHASVNYHHANMHISVNKDQNFCKILALKQLFQLLVNSCGPCSSSLTRIAVFAPLVFELHRFLVECSYVENGLRLDEVVGNEVSCLVDRLVSFISLCCCEGVDDHDDTVAFSPCFVELVKVWTVKRRGKEFEFEDDFRMFFPVVSDEVRKTGLLGGGVGVLAGIVMCQVFLLSLCLKFGLEGSRGKVEEVVLNSAVNTIIGFRSCYFFDTLLKMLLESSLPVNSLLTAIQETVLREALFDAVILVDYPFFNPGSGIRFCSHHLNSLASTWLFVADRAMQLARHIDDQTKAIAYTKAFSKSHIHSQLLRWVSAQIGMAEDAIKPSLSTPAVFLEWLVELRMKASWGFGDEFSLLLDKSMHYKSEIASELTYAKGDHSKDFCLDQRVEEGNKVDGDLEMIDPTHVAKSACTQSLAATEACRKRKGEQDEDSMRVKLLKYHIHGSPIKNWSPFQSEIGLARRS